MKRMKHFDKDRLYECPMCNDRSLYIHEHRVAKCNKCNFTGTIKKHKSKDQNTKELHVDIDGVVYTFEPDKDKEPIMKDLVNDDEICLVENNELICVPKEVIKNKS